jgi:transcriptional regulator with XRE-family HTH domain
MLASRLKQRRRLLHLHQRDVTSGKISSSFLSKVENGSAYPSLRTLRKLAETLDTTKSDLLGDGLVLEAAKATILLTDKCHSYLANLPDTATTRFLRDLSTSATSLSTPVPVPPENVELQYLTAKLLVHRGDLSDAKFLLFQALDNTRNILWRIYLLSLLCQVHEELDEEQLQRKAVKELMQLLRKLDHHNLAANLPDGTQINSSDLDLIKLSSWLNRLKNVPYFPIQPNST